MVRDPGRYAAPLPVITMRPLSRSSMRGMTERAAEVHAEHVDLLARATTPPPAAPTSHRRGRRSPHCDEEVDRSRALARSSPPSARRRRACDTSPVSASPSISAATALTCSARPPGDRDPHACVRELTSDRRADPAPASGDERDAFELVRRHVRSPPGLRGSRASTGHRDPARERARERRGARSSRCASSAGP